MTPAELLDYLRRTDRVRSSRVTAQPLAGGVSSAIYLIDDAGEQFVVKQALPKLRVKDEWFADPGRNAVERAYLDCVGRLSPGSVPRILFHDPAAGLFAMEYFPFAPWKIELLSGIARKEIAQQAGMLLGTVHRCSWEDARLREQFSTTPNFHALRIEPYLITTGQRNPELKSFFFDEAERLAAPGQALVHGDFSPKNMLVESHRLVLLDCEAAWFGDPAFDAAFLLNHFFLKSLHRPSQHDDYLGLANAFWLEYARQLERCFSPDLERRVGRLLLMLMLARVDGKSPVEYLTDPDKQGLMRKFVGCLLRESVFGLNEIIARWQQALLDIKDKTVGGEVTRLRLPDP